MHLMTNYDRWNKKSHPSICEGLLIDEALSQLLKHRCNQLNKWRSTIDLPLRLHAPSIWMHWWRFSAGDLELSLLPLCLCVEEELKFLSMFYTRQKLQRKHWFFLFSVHTKSLTVHFSWQQFRRPLLTF